MREDGKNQNDTQLLQVSMSVEERMLKIYERNQVFP